MTTEPNPTQRNADDMGVPTASTPSAGIASDSYEMPPHHYNREQLRRELTVVVGELMATRKALQEVRRTPDTSKLQSSQIHALAEKRAVEQFAEGVSECRLTPDRPKGGGLQAIADKYADEIQRVCHCDWTTDMRNRASNWVEAAINEAMSAPSAHPDAASLPAEHSILVQWLGELEDATGITFKRGQHGIYPAMAFSQLEALLKGAPPDAAAVEAMAKEIAFAYLMPQENETRMRELNRNFLIEQATLILTRHLRAQPVKEEAT